MKSLLSRLAGFRAAASPWNTDAIIREELFSIERLEEHAASLARSQPVAARPPSRPSLDSRLSENESVLLTAFRAIAAAASRGGAVTPAAQWLLDNYHLIEEQVRQIRSDLPPGFYRQLPKLASGPFTGYPRIFGMAWACVAHSDSRFDVEALRRFVRAYQVVQPLTIGELWAMAITLRIVLVENLRRAAERIVSSRAEREQADCISVTVRNIITSLRLISGVDWTEFFEDVSPVDAALRRASDIAAMDFPTRNLYRSAIEALSRRSSHGELEVTHALIEAIQAVSDADPEVLRKRDPGYHLLGRGRRALRRSLGYRAPISDWLGALNESLGPAGYIASVLAVAACIVILALLALPAGEIAPAQLLACALLGLVPAIDVAVALVNRAATRGFGATMLPGLALRDGVPASLRTMVVVPTLLTTREALETQLERLEVHYLASPQGELHFALLSDWTDAAKQDVPGDAALLKLAVDGIARLNHAHPAPSQGERFYVLHRRRVWSEGQQQWMGWERKRGKLHELNQLLRGAVDTSFVDSTCVDTQAPGVPTSVRYVITLDADTRLPRESVRRLIGKLAHPLNHPRFDATTGRVVEGYAVLQPRVTPSLSVGREGSLFQRTFSSTTGIDPYGAAASDVYQDLFGEGSYAGKGIYEIDAFESALADRVSENSLLSHDLFEGTFARAGLVSDIEVVEEFPSRYDVSAARNHRWARGDWQLLPWLLGRVDAARNGTSSLPLLGRWKMLDNLRRTASAPASLLALLAGWLLPTNAALVWTAFVITAIALPVLLPAVAAAVPRPGVGTRSHLRALRRDLALAFAQIALLVTFLAHQAWLMCDAIFRTLYRMVVSRRHLLEWVTAAQAQLTQRLGLAGTYRRMSASVAVALIAVVLVGITAFPTVWVALPFVILWIAAPAIAVWISEAPPAAGRLSVSAADRQSLRLIARRTWRYFETFVTAADHMLPPDNFQEDPQPTVAHRTSPTNVGLYLLSAVSARDFGWAGTLDTVERLEATLATMQRLQRFRGHFYNWYDTSDLRPLEPHYVSSVDSGNLAAHLITVANACREWISVPIENAARIDGIEDAVHLAREALHALPDDRRTQTFTRLVLADVLPGITTALRKDAATSNDSSDRLDNATAYATILVDSARALAGKHEEAAYGDLLFWAEATQRSIRSWQRDVKPAHSAGGTLRERLRALESATRTMAFEMEFGFLLDPVRRLLSIGCRTSDGTLDESWYDLLASEARLASFFAVAKNDVPTRHWFRLGRTVTPIGRGAALISWSGSMFEYLMPSLVMRAPAGSLIEQTSRLIVRRQISYGDSRHVPWGVSESAYSARDLELTYQYSNFGVPGLGLKRGLSKDIVVAPYATGLAAMVDPTAAMRNFTRLAGIGALGRHGFYEALDYTRSRLPDDTEFVIVKAFMAHHQGMTIVALANVLFDGRPRARFHAEAAVQATELLLHERTPRDVSVAHRRREDIEAHDGAITLSQLRECPVSLSPAAPLVHSWPPAGPHRAPLFQRRIQSAAQRPLASRHESHTSR